MDGIGIKTINIGNKKKRKIKYNKRHSRQNKRRSRLLKSIS